MKPEEIKEAIKKGQIDPDQAWFWTDEWQAAEKEVDEDIKAGRVTTANS